MYITKNGSKPSASSFKREYCGAIINQKVPKVFEVYRQKRAPARSEGSRRREISVKIQEKQGFLPHKRDKCRICLVDKFGIYHVYATPNGVQRWVFAPNGVFLNYSYSFFNKMLLYFPFWNLFFFAAFF